MIIMIIFQKSNEIYISIQSALITLKKNHENKMHLFLLYIYVLFFLERKRFFLEK